jgi:transcriptional regulator with XRE-family HTH domain
MAHLGNNIAKLRGLRQIPQKDLAAKLNLTQPEYSRLEAKAEIDESMLELIAKALDFPVELIKELENNPIQSIHNSGNINDSVFYQNNPVEKIIELYERMLKEKDAFLLQKDEVIEMYKKQQKAS